MIEAIKLQNNNSISEIMRDSHMESYHPRDKINKTKKINNLIRGT